jgi:hypothetical protein
VDIRYRRVSKSRPIQPIIETVSDILALEDSEDDGLLSRDCRRRRRSHSEDSGRRWRFEASRAWLTTCKAFRNPVDVLDPFRQIEVDDKKFDPDYMKEIVPEMAVAVGLALRGVERHDQDQFTRVGYRPAHRAALVEDKVANPLVQTLLLALTVFGLAFLAIGYDYVSSKSAHAAATVGTQNQKLINATDACCATRADGAGKEGQEIQDRIDAIKRLRESQQGPSAVLA